MCVVCGCSDTGFTRSPSVAEAGGASASHAGPRAGLGVDLHFGAGAARVSVPGISQARALRIEADILGANDRIAARNRAHFAAHGVTALNLVSSPGSGKTTLLCATLRLLQERAAGLPLAVIEGDQQTRLDAERIRATGVPAIQVNTGKGCHLDAPMVAQAFARLHVHAEGEHHHVAAHDHASAHGDGHAHDHHDGHTHTHDHHDGHTHAHDHYDGHGHTHDHHDGHGHTHDHHDGHTHTHDHQDGHVHAHDHHDGHTHTHDHHDGHGHTHDHGDGHTHARVGTHAPGQPAGAGAGGLLFIENVGNLVCPALWDLGEAAKVALLSVTEGEDKPLKYPDLFAAARLLIINKIDLLPHVVFDVQRCVAMAREVNPDLEVLTLSATTGEGMDAWLSWLLQASGHPPFALAAQGVQAAPASELVTLRARVVQLEAELARLADRGQA